MLACASDVFYRFLVAREGAKCFKEIEEKTIENVEQNDEKNVKSVKSRSKKNGLYILRYKDIIFKKGTK